MPVAPLVVVALALAQGGQVMLLDFSAKWCGPCQQMAPVMHDLAAQGYPVQAIDIDQQPELAKRFRVEAVPTFVLLVNGQEQRRTSGAVSAGELESWFREAGLAPGAQAAAPAVPAVPGAPSLPAGSPAAPGMAMPAAMPSVPSVPGAFPSAAGISEVTSASAANAPAAGMASAPGGPAPATEAGGLAIDAPPRLLAVTVRLKIEDPQGASYGTGTLVDTRGNEALILTCGHLFRESKGEGRVTVDLFGAGAPQGLPARLVSFDLERDLGLLSVRVDRPVLCARIAPPDYVLSAGQSVISMGCDHGGEPNARASRVSSLNKYLGPPNVQVAGQPVQGRSGGGLFSTEGLLIGVCHAADPQDDEGLYAAFPSVHAALDALQLASVYGGIEQPAPSDVALAGRRSTTGGAPGQAPPAHFVPPDAVPPMDLSAEANAGAGAGAGLAGGTPPGMSASERATLDFLRHQPDGAEVVCVIRRLDDPRAKSEILVLDRASPEFLRQLGAEQRAQQGRFMTASLRTRPQEEATIPSRTGPALADPRVPARTAEGENPWRASRAR